MEDEARRFPCPCGNGFYEIYVIGYQGKEFDSYSMLCPKCEKKYVYVNDYETINFPQGNELHQGWVLKTEYKKKKKKYIDNIEEKIKELYFDTWVNLFDKSKNKKELWDILTMNGKYPPKLNKFYIDLKSLNNNDLMEEINKYFTYDNLSRIFEVCDIEPDWDYIGIEVRERKRLYPDKYLRNMVDRLRLKAELVPKTSWYDNLRKHTTKTEWDKIRLKTNEDFGNKCGICGSEEKLECHEIWDYDDENKIQKLKGFIALCKMCHLIKHIGYAQSLASKGKLDINQLIEHFKKINCCDNYTFELHNTYVFRKWRERSEHQWNVELGEHLNVTK